MYVCLCSGVTENQIRTAVRAGDTSLSQLKRNLGVAAQCGGCLDHARDILHEIKFAEASSSLATGDRAIGTPVPAFSTPLYYSAA
ncbi:MAG: bacterioferritin-associated ferredoxin [Pseudomonadota bacterium]